MNNSGIYAIVEGCDHDNPECLHYLELCFPIPDNSKIIVTGWDKSFSKQINNDKGTKLLLYASFNPLSANTRILTLPKPKNGELEFKFNDPQYPDNQDWLNWAFEMPRSIITKDGRVFVNEVHYQNGFQYYLKKIDTIIIDSIEVFRGYKGITQMLERRLI